MSDRGVESRVSAERITDIEHFVMNAFPMYVGACSDVARRFAVAAGVADLESENERLWGLLMDASTALCYHTKAERDAMRERILEEMKRRARVVLGDDE